MTGLVYVNEHDVLPVGLVLVRLLRRNVRVLFEVGGFDALLGAIAPDLGDPVQLVGVGIELQGH